mmetsp:Transcript_28150/g.60221  ORF Transcript_28150/g.60221 Transcript_28150/m.60221 type:complete len:230 (+) Transcript_28150:1845-2534(+)
MVTSSTRRRRRSFFRRNFRAASATGSSGVAGADLDLKVAVAVVSLACFLGAGSKIVASAAGIFFSPGTSSTSMGRGPPEMLSIFLPLPPASSSPPSISMLSIFSALAESAPFSLSAAMTASSVHALAEDDCLFSKAASLAIRLARISSSDRVLALAFPSLLLPLLSLLLEPPDPSPSPSPFPPAPPAPPPRAHRAMSGRNPLIFDIPRVITTFAGVDCRYCFCYFTCCY